MNAARAPLASAAAYLALTCVMGRDVLASLGTAIASDPGDPILNAAILAWNATHVPATEAWYQFPIFYPTGDALVLSEHLLGLSLFATPIYWATGSALVAYNVTLLLSYPLTGMAMYALAWRLTRSAPAAFLAGLAFAFAPYRASQLPHIQVLVVFWAPLALLGLHAFVETRRRRWLGLFGTAWLLQGASNGYFLVYFSLVAALWVLWFVAARRRWRDLAWIAAATAVAALPLAPVLYRYLVAQHALGVSRNLGEIASFGADIAAPLCAPASLTFWGWLRVACAQEGDLFVGAAFLALCLAGGLALRHPAPAVDGAEPAVPDAPTDESGTGGSRPHAVRRLFHRAALAGAVVYLLIAAITLLGGGWRLDFGFVRVSASSADKPLSVALALLLVALLLSRWWRRVVSRGSTAAFYLGAALVCWVLSWGPFPRLLGADALYQAPFAWLLQLPGVGALRVPARFWMMTVLCLAVFMAIALAPLLRTRRRGAAAAFTAAAACALLADGWTTITAAAVPGPPFDAATIRGRVVLAWPAGDLDRDVAAVYHAVAGGWRTVNGFSGYEPGYYEALRTLSRARDTALLAPFQAAGELDVVFDETDSSTRAVVAAERGARLIRRAGGKVLYRLPRVAVAGPPPRPGPRLGISGLAASCSPEGLPLAIDGDPDTRWVCGPQLADHELTADLGAVSRVAAVVHTLGTAGADFPRYLVVETSRDGSKWEPAWTGSPAAEVLRAALAAPRLTQVVVTFGPREARYVRLRQTGRDDRNYWSIAELEIRGLR